MTRISELELFKTIAFGGENGNDSLTFRQIIDRTFPDLNDGAEADRLATILEKFMVENGSDLIERIPIQ